MKHLFLFILTLILSGAMALGSVLPGVTEYQDEGMERIADLNRENTLGPSRYSVSGSRQGRVMVGVLPLSRRQKIVAELAHWNGEKLVSLKDKDLADSNVIEIDGIRFQTLLIDTPILEDELSLPPEKHLFRIPDKPDGKTIFFPILRITNQTKNNILFGRFGIIKLSLVRPDGELTKVGDYYAWSGSMNPTAVGSALAKPGDSINFLTQVKLFWKDRKLILVFSDSPQNPFYLDNIQPGEYKIQLTYNNKSDEVDWNDNSPFSIIIEGERRYYTPPPTPSPRVVWKGTATTPFVKFRIAQ
jgi:hypothetical protein